MTILFVCNQADGIKQFIKTNKQTKPMKYRAIIKKLWFHLNACVHCIGNRIWVVCIEHHTVITNCMILSETNIWNNLLTNQSAKTSACWTMLVTNLFLEFRLIGWFSSVSTSDFVRRTISSLSCVMCEVIVYCIELQYGSKLHIAVYARTVRVIVI